MFLIKKVLFLFLTTAVCSFAGDTVWHRSHYIALGVEAPFSWGDLDGKGSFVADDDEGETIYIPRLGTFPLPTIEIGANINQHTIAVSFAMWEPDVNYGKGTDNYTETDANYWRAMFEYRYYFFWPEDFQVGLGLSYSFSRYSVHSAVFGKDKYDEDKRSTAIYGGNGFAPSINLRYEITQHLGLDAALRYRLMYFGSVSTDDGGYSDLSENLWENFFEISAKAYFQF